MKTAIHDIQINALSLREKIGQTVLSLCLPEEHTAKYGGLREFIEKYPIGGMYPAGRLVNGKMQGMGNKEFQSVFAEYDRYGKIPLIAACDEPNDDGKGDIFTTLMTLGAANDARLAYEYGQCLGARARACGLHWIFAPVVDLSLSAESPVTNARALSDEPGRAVPLALQIIRGIQSEGAAATAKHFPGTDDSEKIDPHLAPVNNAITKEKWAATNGKMYEAVIGGGVYAVMTGHQNIPAYQTRKSNGRYPPATASEEAVSGLLKDKLGFQGVAVTDALNMGGFVGADGLKNQVESLKAGNDMLLWPALEYIDEAERKVLAGELPMARLDEAVSRVLALKGKVMPPNGAINRAAPDKERALALSREINEKGITLVQNVRGVLPNAALKKALVVAVTPDERNYADLRRLAGIFAQYGVAADVRRDIWQDALYESQEEYDLIIFALCRMTHRPIGPLDFWGDNAASIWASNSADLSKTVTVSFGNPYAFKYYRETEMTYINAYSPERAALEAFAKGITGIIPFTGTSPVRLS